MHQWAGCAGVTPGAVVSPQVVYDLGVAWYATRLNHDWSRPDKDQVAAIFARHGLTGPFWSLDGVSGGAG
ncbi:MAG: hypothetical protein IT179_17625 [Acidobacteria bacterium]|nr:hypothetical protein [Acidobacteriota bacterium]